MRFRALPVVFLALAGLAAVSLAADEPAGPMPVRCEAQPMATPDALGSEPVLPELSPLKDAIPADHCGTDWSCASGEQACAEICSPCPYHFTCTHSNCGFCKCKYNVCF